MAPVTWARIVNGAVAEVLLLPPGVTPGKDVFVGWACVACPPETALGATLAADGSFTAPVPPALTRDELTAAIRAEFARRITAALGDDLKQSSMQREATALLQKLAIGTALTDVETADAAILLAINDWEGAMVDAREALIAAADATYAQDSRWPSVPAAVTAAWLAGY